MVSIRALVVWSTFILLIPLCLILVLTVWSMKNIQVPEDHESDKLEGPSISKSPDTSTGEHINSPTGLFFRPENTKPSRDCDSQILPPACKDPSTCFALDFVKTFEAASKNLIFSPFGILISYAMLLKGAHGKSQAQIMQVLRLTPRFSDSQAVDAEINKAVIRYNSSKENFKLFLTNLAIFSEKVQVKPDYLQVLRSQYNTNIMKENFEDGEGVRQRINAIISKNTDSLVTQLLDQAPDPQTLMVLINTIFFKSSWQNGFNPKDTRTGNFYNSDGTLSSVNMMHMNGGKFPYVEFLDKKLKIMELPYHENISMYVMAPQEMGQLQVLVRDLTEDKLNSYLTLLEPMQFKIVSIPKFTLRQSFELDKILPEMGLCLPFTKDAEFQGISDSKIEVSKSFQKSIVQMDENGTIAAAVTSLDAIFYAADLMRIFILDHPFLFIIRDKTNSLTLFFGVVNYLPSK